MSPRILVVDHDPQIRKLLRVSLGVNGYDVVEAETAHMGIAALFGQSFALMILGLNLPDTGGQNVITRIRESSDIPIVVLSENSAAMDEIEALDRGADDVVSKPFSVPELIARIGAVLRPRIVSPAEQTLRLGAVEIDLSRQVVSRGGAEIHLSKKEWDLLSLLARHPNQVLTHGHILTEIWGQGHAEDTAYLRVYVSQLRQKLEADPTRPAIILTEPALGYRLRRQN
jgi:two-component system KDP operon response regulator KdpE